MTMLHQYYPSDAARRKLPDQGPQEVLFLGSSLESSAGLHDRTGAKIAQTTRGH
jgi:hypothetical protein